MNNEFEELLKKRNELGTKLAGLIVDMKPKKQTELLNLVNELINIEIEMEKYCNL